MSQKALHAEVDVTYLVTTEIIAKPLPDIQMEDALDKEVVTRMLEEYGILKRQYDEARHARGNLVLQYAVEFMLSWEYEEKLMQAMETESLMKHNLERHYKVLTENFNLSLPDPFRSPYTLKAA